MITRGNSKDASQRDRDLAGGRSKALRDRYAPFFLRREKKEVLRQDARSRIFLLNRFTSACIALELRLCCSYSAACSSEGEEAASSGSAPVPQRMGRKNDLVIWLRLQPQQRRVYLASLSLQTLDQPPCWVSANRVYSAHYHANAHMKHLTFASMPVQRLCRLTIVDVGALCSLHVHTGMCLFQSMPCHQAVLQAFLNSQAVKDALNHSRSPLAAITVLKKICVHPYLLNERAIDAVAAAGRLPSPIWTFKCQWCPRHLV